MPNYAYRTLMAQISPGSTADDQLNMLGAEGWNLAWMVPVVDPNYPGWPTIVYTLKKEQ